MSDGYGSRNANPFDSDNQSKNQSSNQFTNNSNFTNQSTFSENNQFQTHSETSFSNNRSPFQFNQKRQSQSFMDMNHHQQPVLLRDPSNLRASSGKAGNRMKFKNFTGFAQIYADNLFEDFFNE